MFSKAYPLSAISIVFSGRLQWSTIWQRACVSFILGRGWVTAVIYLFSQISNKAFKCIWKNTLSLRACFIRYSKSFLLVGRLISEPSTATRWNPLYVLVKGIFSLKDFKRYGKKSAVSFFRCCVKADLDGTFLFWDIKKLNNSVFVLFMVRQRVAFTVSEKGQSLCLVISEPGVLTYKWIFFSAVSRTEKKRFRIVAGVMYMCGTSLK